MSVHEVLQVTAPQHPPHTDEPLRPRAPVVGTLFENRALDAFAKSLVCFALSHQLLLAVDAIRTGHAGGFNVFTMIEAHRLLPALGSGAPSVVLSFLFALGVYALVYALFTRQTDAVRADNPETTPSGQNRPTAPGAAPLRFARAAIASTRGVASTREVPRHASAHASPLPHPRGVLSLVPAVLPFRVTLPMAIGVAVAGVALHMGALALVERWVSVFPPVPDVVHAHLPYVDFGVPGELCFAAFLATVITVLFRRQRHQAPEILALIGLFYGLRGLFLFALPIGLPPTAPALAARFVLYPFAGHAYFPGGHAGVMTILSLCIADRRWRLAMLAATAVFGFGTLLARTHYTADVLGGFVVGYAVFAWGERWLKLRTNARRHGA